MLSKRVCEQCKWCGIIKKEIGPYFAVSCYKDDRERSWGDVSGMTYSWQSIPRACPFYLEHLVDVQRSR